MRHRRSSRAMRDRDCVKCVRNLSRTSAILLLITAHLDAQPAARADASRERGRGEAEADRLAPALRLHASWFLQPVPLPTRDAAPRCEALPGCRRCRAKAAAPGSAAR